jgi:hypothetical protein
MEIFLNSLEVSNRYVVGNLVRLPSDVYKVSETKSAVTRRCPFCERTIQDVPGGDINFIVHLGAGIPEHQNKWTWANYITTINHI